jgi:hypothetical protein
MCVWRPLHLSIVSEAVKRKGASVDVCQLQLKSSNTYSISMPCYMYMCLIFLTEYCNINRWL